MNDHRTNFEETAHFHAIIVARRIDVPVEEVWAAWVEPDRISRWFSPDTEQDVRVGGRYRNGDGDEGEFLEVVPNRRLKFTWEQPDYAPGSFVIVDLLPSSDGSTEVRVEHANVACDDAGDLELGWNWSIDSLDSYLRTGTVISFETWAATHGLL